MRKVLLITMLLMSAKCFSQDSIRSLNIKLKAVRYSSLFISGFADGLNDAISFHYGSFQKVHPNANPQFWNPELSWTNKYMYGDVRYGEKFLGSSTMFVFTTDGFHLTNMINRMSFVGGTIFITIGENKSWKYYLKELVIGYGFNRLGFIMSYNLIYR